LFGIFVAFPSSLKSLSSPSISSRCLARARVSTSHRRASSSTRDTRRAPRAQRSIPFSQFPPPTPPFSSPSGGRGKKAAGKATSKSAKAGLQFPVGRVARYMKKMKVASRVGAGAPVYLAAGAYTHCESPPPQKKPGGVGRLPPSPHRRARLRRAAAPRLPLL
jgi:hypothetical protein